MYKKKPVIDKVLTVINYNFDTRGKVTFETIKASRVTFTRHNVNEALKELLLEEKITFDGKYYYPVIEETVSIQSIPFKDISRSEARQ